MGVPPREKFGRTDQPGVGSPDKGTEVEDAVGVADTVGVLVGRSVKVIVWVGVWVGRFV